MTTLARFAFMALVAAAAATALAVPGPPARPERGTRVDYKYATMARCNTKDCHGADAAKGSPALNEYNIWKSVDPHSKAFTTLYKAPSKAIGEKMSIAKVHESPKCLTCHSKVVDPAQVVPNQKWSVQGGVSCEVCHGPGEKWVDPHATPKEKNWSHEQSVANGMADLRDLVKWSAQCASCHLQIDHDMVTAGHPRLHFELVDYNARTGAHWKTEKHPSMQAGFDARAWTVGQAVSFAEALRNLARRMSAKAPEERLKDARDQAAAHLRVLKHVGGLKAPAEIPADAARLEEAAAAAEAQAKGLAPADESVLAKLAAEEPPRDFSSARQVALAFRALSKKADAKAAIDKACDAVAAKNEAAFDPAKFAADFEAVRKSFK
jgi:hypothetical protein